MGDVEAQRAHLSSRCNQAYVLCCIATEGLAALGASAGRAR